MVFVDLPIWEAASRLLLAAVLGMFAGFEREFRRKPAGMRTHMLVAGSGFSAPVLSYRAGEK